MKITVGGADQGELVFVGDGEDDPTIFVLENIGPLMVKQFFDDDMTALHHTNMFFRCAMGDMVEQFVKPGAGGIDQCLAST